MAYLGDFADGATVYGYFSTHEAAGGNVAPLSAFEAADVVVYKDGSATQLTVGITVTSPFDTETGFHSYSIDTTQTGYDAGSDYAVVLAPDETVDGATITAVLLDTFSIQNRYNTVTTGAISANAVSASALATDAVTEIAAGVLGATLDGTVSAHEATPTLEEALFEIKQQLQEGAASGTTVTVRAPDGTTSLMTLTLDDAANPTSITRTT